MAAVTQENLAPVIEPYNGRLHAVIDRAWKRFAELPALHRLVLAPGARTRANCIWSYIAKEARAEFDDDPNVEISEPRNSLILIIENKLVVRFKKLDRNGASRNYPTRRARKFNGQREIEGIPSELPRVDVGYVENPTGTGYLRVEVSHRNGDTVAWHYAIEPEVTVMPIGAERSGEATRIRRRGVQQLRIETTNDGGGGDAT